MIISCVAVLPRLLGSFFYQSLYNICIGGLYNIAYILKLAKAKKISFQKVEEKESSIPTLIQKGEISEIKKLLDDNPSGIAHYLHSVMWRICLNNQKVKLKQASLSGINTRHTKNFGPKTA